MSRRSAQPSAASVFVRNLETLGFTPPVDSNWVVNEQTFTVNRNSIKAFECISHFLFHLLDEKKARNTFTGVWPISNNRESLEYRQRAFQWLKNIQAGTCLSYVPLRKSYFTDCHGEPFNKIVSAFTTFVLDKQKSNKARGIRDNNNMNTFISYGSEPSAAGKRSTGHRPPSTEILNKKKIRTKYPNDLAVSSSRIPLYHQTVSVTQQPSSSTSFVKSSSLSKLPTWKTSIPSATNPTYVNTVSSIVNSPTSFSFSNTTNASPSSEGLPTFLSLPEVVSLPPRQSSLVTSPVFESVRFSALKKQKNQEHLQMKEETDTSEEKAEEAKTEKEAAVKAEEEKEAAAKAEAERIKRHLEQEKTETAKSETIKRALKQKKEKRAEAERTKRDLEVKMAEAEAARIKRILDPKEYEEIVENAKNIELLEKVVKEKMMEDDFRVEMLKDIIIEESGRKKITKAAKEELDKLEQKEADKKVMAAVSKLEREREEKCIAELVSEAQKIREDLERVERKIKAKMEAEKLKHELEVEEMKKFQADLKAAKVKYAKDKCEEDRWRDSKLNIAKEREVIQAEMGEAESQLTILELRSHTLLTKTAIPVVEDEEAEFYQRKYAEQKMHNDKDICNKNPHPPVSSVVDATYSTQATDYTHRMDRFNFGQNSYDDPFFGSARIKGVVNTGAHNLQKPNAPQPYINSALRLWRDMPI